MFTLPELLARFWRALPPFSDFAQHGRVVQRGQLDAGCIDVDFRAGRAALGATVVAIVAIVAVVAVVATAVGACEGERGNQTERENCQGFHVIS